MIRSRKIYLASSWKNAYWVRDVANVLRGAGNEVFDFTDPNHRPDGKKGFAFSMDELIVALGDRKREDYNWIEMMELEPSRRAYRSDKAGLDWCDTLILILPCGRSAHMEAGYVAGKEKDVIIFGDLPMGEFETMYHLARRCYRAKDMADMMEFLEGR